MAAFKMIRLLMFLKEVVRYTQCTYLYKYFTLLCVIHKRNIRLALRLIQVFTCKIIWCDYSVNLGITKSSPPTILKLILEALDGLSLFHECSNAVDHMARKWKRAREGW